MGNLRKRIRRSPAEPAYADVQAELTELIFHKVAAQVVISSLGLIGSTVMLAERYGDTWLWDLSALMLAAGLARLGVVLAFRFRGDRPLAARAARTWGRLHASTTMLHCSTLVIMTLYSFRFHDQTAWSLCTLGTFIFCAGLSARLGMTPWITQCTGLMMLGALAFCVLRSEDRLARVGALFICGFAFVFWESVQSKFEMVVEQLRTRRRLRELAEQDGLTGLMNRRHFQQCLGEACSAKASCAVLYIDLDRFKAVNDAHGHRAGDLLLQQVSARLRSVVRSTDLLARLGGDEFAILHGPQATEDSAEALAGRINAVIDVPFLIDEDEILIGASVGIRLALPGDDDPQRLLSLADRALYRVKQTGRGSFSFARD
jgi:diguanylate cyclase (GGDEF)-like protein